MKIDQLNIDGFGIFHNKEIKGFKKGINILYGNNEAGKSTLLDFIRFTLFEYPRFWEDRRPPLNGGKHGGRLFLKNNVEESFSIYRHGNNKDVLFGYNGEETSNLQQYKQFIGNASIDLYKNVYAITLDELLRVGQLSESGMEDRIFSMGMGLSGVDFGKFENNLIEHSLNYFKPSGRIQILPELVDQIQEKEDVIAKLQSKLGEYNQLADRKDQLTNELESIEKKRSELSIAKNKFSDFSRAYESYVQFKTAQEELDELGNILIQPTQYLNELEENKRQIGDYKQQIKRVENVLKQIKEEQEQFNWDKDLSQQAHLLDYFKTNIKLYEEAKSIIAQEKAKQEKAETQAKSIYQRLGLEMDKQNILKITGTFELQSLATGTTEKNQNYQRILDSKNDVEQRISREVESLQEVHKKTGSQLEEHPISNDSELQQAIEERAVLDTSFQQALHQSGGPKKTSKLAVILALVFLLVGGVLFFVNLLAGGIVTGVAVLGLLVVLFSSKSNPIVTDSDNAVTTNKKLEVLKMDIVEYNELSPKLHQTSVQLSDKKEELERIQKERNSTEEQLAKTEQDWKAELHKKHLPVDLSPQRMGDFISNIEEYKRQYQIVQEAARVIKSNKQRILDFEEKLQHVLPDKEQFESAAIYDVIKAIESNEKSKEEIDRLLENEKHQLKELARLQSELDRYEKEQLTLLKKVGVDSEATFYEYFDQQEHFQNAQEKQSNAANTIRTICGADALESTLKELVGYTPAELKTQKESTESEYDTVKKQYDELNRELAGISADIRHILEPDEMFSLQNKKESLQEELRTHTQEWLSTKMALAVLSESKQRYEQERQPEVITQTRDYFKAITENAYEDLRISLSAKHVSLIDRHGKQKTVEQLSRGTREQLLLALRLGLIEEYEKNAEPLPIALDDIMVNFDEERTENLAKVLTEFAQNRQVILFTCHPETRDLFATKNATIIDW